MAKETRFQGASQFSLFDILSRKGRVFDNSQNLYIGISNEFPDEWLSWWLFPRFSLVTFNNNEKETLLSFIFVYVIFYDLFYFARLCLYCEQCFALQLSCAMEKLLSARTQLLQFLLLQFTQCFSVQAG